MENRIARYPDMLPAIEVDDTASKLIELLSSGGDARITLDNDSGLNRYFSAPYPRRTIAYASSTANDLSMEAFGHLKRFVEQGQPDYAIHLENLRGRIRAAYELSDDVEVVFAPSGTDLEYVALAAMLGKADGGIHNILLGADEVGSGCIHSAHGRYFAKETALEISVEPGSAVEGLGHISLSDIPVRCEEGLARSSETITQSIAHEIELAIADDRHALVHVVHGSKTGLILPELSELDRLSREYRDSVSFVVDACQARITTEALHAYIDRGAMVFLTGSKFMGGAPFNGFALVPRQMITSAPSLPKGLANVFRRAEFPVGWEGREQLPDSENPGLALRYEASIFELERFQDIAFAEIERIIASFARILKREIIEPLGLHFVLPHEVAGGVEAREHPIEMRTLATLDVSSLERTPTFEAAQQFHRELALDGMRLGQPVKSVRKDGQWGGTLRIGLSMPQISRWATMDQPSLETALTSDMQMIAGRLRQGEPD